MCGSLLEGSKADLELRLRPDTNRVTQINQIGEHSHSADRDFETQGFLVDAEGLEPRRSPWKGETKPQVRDLRRSLSFDSR
jgi:hypothetical protein